MTLETLANQLADFEYLASSQPLGSWRAWQSAKTSQRTAAQLIADHKTVLISGGNRSGKTQIALRLLLAFALGGDCADVEAFCALNGIPAHTIPGGPGTCFIVALTSGASRRYHRDTIDSLIPKYCPFKWYNKNGKGEAELRVWVPGYERPAVIYFLSEDQGDSAMQGVSCRAILHDEEGKTPHGWDECEKRLWDCDGWQIMANTPKDGKTWVYDRFVDTGHPDYMAEAAVYYLHSRDNPHISKNRLSKLHQGDSNLAAARLRGEFVTLSGAVWPDFDRRLHTYDPAAMELDASWPRFRGADHGTVNPTAVVWGALDPEGCLWVYRVHYQAGVTTDAHAAAIKRAEGYEPVPTPGGLQWRAVDSTERIERSWMDPAARKFRVELGRHHDIRFSLANNDRQGGIDELATRLQTHECAACGWRGVLVHKQPCPDCTADTLLIIGPLLRISRACEVVIREVEGLRRPDDARADRDRSERYVKKNDHSADALRYLCMGLRRYR